eukprot:4370532-Prymnesium_polylepis.1
MNVKVVKFRNIRAANNFKCGTNLVKSSPTGQHFRRLRRSQKGTRFLTRTQSRLQRRASADLGTPRTLSSSPICLTFTLQASFSLWSGAAQLGFSPEMSRMTYAPRRRCGAGGADRCDPRAQSARRSTSGEMFAHDSSHGQIQAGKSSKVVKWNGLNSGRVVVTMITQPS